MTDDSARADVAPYPEPPPYRWPAGKRSAVCLSVDVDAEAPWLWTHRSALPDTLGQLEHRRFGPRRGLWRLATLFDELGTKGSFYVPSVVAELHPEILPALVEHGHEIALHGHRHELVADVTDDEFDDALARSLAVFERQCAIVPTGFRSPAWEMTPHMLGAIAARGLAYDSSLMGFDHPYEIGSLVEIPVQWAIDDAIHFKFLGGGADRWPPAAPAAVESAWHEEWATGHRHGALFTVTLHPWISGRSRVLGMLERLLAPIVERDDVWCATAADIAAWHATSVNAGRHRAAPDHAAESAALERSAP